jgi:host factor-I protein
MEMAEAHAQGLQDTILTHLREHRIPVTIFLANGIRLQGRISDFDKFGVLLTREGQAQLVYKRAISAIHPVQAVQLLDSDQPVREVGGAAT